MTRNGVDNGVSCTSISLGQTNTNKALSIIPKCPGHVLRYMIRVYISLVINYRIDNPIDSLIDSGSYILAHVYRT